MSSNGRKVTYDGLLFRIEEQPIPGRCSPYEFARRIGVVVVLPVVFSSQDCPAVLTITNDRTYYGTSEELPGGHRDGGFDQTEPVEAAALRELREETGYGYPDGVIPQLTAFRLRRISKTIDYPRHLVIARGVTYLGGEENNPHEVVRSHTVPISEFLEPLLTLSADNLYVEMNVAFARAAMNVGKTAVSDWLADASSPRSEEVVACFKPWLVAE